MRGGDQGEVQGVGSKGSVGVKGEIRGTKIRATRGGDQGEVLGVGSKGSMGVKEEIKGVLMGPGKIWGRSREDP